MPFLNFSDWIIVWFILYFFKIVNNSPLFILFFGLLVNIGFVIKLIFEKCNIKLTIFGNMCIKFFMTIYLFKRSSFNITDFIFGIVLFIIYNIWLYKTHNLNLSSLIEKNINNNKISSLNLNIDDINKININKINETNDKYIKNIDEINKKYKNKLNKSGFKIDENKLDDIMKKYKNKLNKVYSYFNDNLVTLNNDLC